MNTTFPPTQSFAALRAIAALFLIVGGSASTAAPVAAALKPAAISAPMLAAPVRKSSPVVAASAPTTVFSVGTETVAYTRTAEDGAVRSLPTKIYYPATVAGVGSPVAEGRFPLILFSHGLDGTYDTYPGPIGKLVQAGFIVAAPEYPHSKKGSVTIFDDAYRGRQSLDASQVITNVLARDTTPGDKFYGRINASAGVGAAGHSLGGVTTSGLLGMKRDNRITGAVLYAPQGIGTPAGPAVKVLFQHGDGDLVLTYASGRSAYNAIPSSWPKAFLTHLGGGHWQYLWPNGPNYTQTWMTTVDWFRWSLYNDWAAYGRLQADALGTGGTKWETSNLINLQVEAETYVVMDGVKTEASNEGSDNVAGIDAGDWMVYVVDVPVAGTYTVQYRVASLPGGGVIQLQKRRAGEVYGTVAVPATGGWQTWTTVSHQVSLPAGKQRLGIKAAAGGFNLNWFRIFR